MKLLDTKLQFFYRLRNDRNRGYETAKEKIWVRNNRNYRYEMTENYGYETARVRKDWRPSKFVNRVFKTLDLVAKG